MMRERFQQLWKSWGRPMVFALLLCSSAFLAGFWFTKGATAAGGLVTITVTYQDQE